MPVRPNVKAIRDASPGAAMLEALRAGTDNVRAYQWPGAPDDVDAGVVLVPLNCDELQDAYAAAHARFDDLKLPLNHFTSDDYFSEINLQVIARSMRSPADRSERMFADADELRSLISPDERTALTTQYLELVNEADPDPADMSPEVIEQIDDLVKKKDALALSVLPSRTLAAYVIGTADPSEI